MKNKFGMLKQELPREKLMKFGPESLTDIELLAIIIRVGTKNKNVIELSREIIDKFSQKIISNKIYDELLNFKGISYAKACQIVSVFELAKRFSNKKTKKQKKLISSNQVFNCIKNDFYNLNLEKVMIIYVNTKNNIIKKEFISSGGLNFSIIEPRKIIKRCLNLDASGFFLIHNHPSSDTTPSEQDRQITKDLNLTCKRINIRFLDHLIVCDNHFFSFFDNDLL